MKKSIWILFLLLAVTVLFCACDAESAGEVSSAPGENVPSLVIAADGVSQYTIVRSDINEAAKDAATELRAGIRELTGVNLPITTDWDKNPVSEYEILVGETEREGTYTDVIDRTGLFDDGYVMKVSGTRLILTGGGHDGAVNAVREFLSAYVTESGVSVPENLNTAKLHEFPVKAVTVNGEDISAFRIDYDASAGASVKKAAEELRFYLREVCGAELPLSGIPAPDGKRIYVHASDTDTEGFSYKSDADGIIISGGKTRGALYGVYHFLEDCVGMRFLTADAEYCIPAEEIKLENLDYTYDQYFEYRDSYWTAYFDAGISAKRMINSANSRSIPAELGGSLGYTGSFVHTMTNLAGCAPDKQPCLTDETVYETVLTNVLAMLKENPDAKIISVSQNDNYNYCKCAKCSAVDEEEGSHAGTVIRFVNRIAEAVAEQYPNVAIHTLAYQYSRQAPKVTVPRDNVIIQLCTIECCFNHALDDPDCERNVSLKKDIEDWGKICKRIYIWDYVTNFRYYLMPFPNFDIMAANMRFFHENNVRGLFEEGNYQGPSGELGELRSYLLARLMENPYMTDAEYDTAVNEFLYGYYGDGWESIRKFYDFITDCGNTRKHFGIYDDYVTTLGGLSFREHADELVMWFDDAEARAGTDTQLEHVRRTRLSCDYIRLSQCFDSMYYSEDFINKEKDRESILAQTEALYNAITSRGVRLREGSENPALSRFDYKPFEW